MTAPGPRSHHDVDAGDGTGGEERHLVRPRWIWGALAVLILGSVALGVGVILLSWTWSIIGVVLLVAGAGVGLAAGVMYDVNPGHDDSDEMTRVIEGDVHQGVAPGDMVNDPALRRTATETTALSEAAMSRPAPAHPAMAHAAGWLLLLVPAIIFLAEPFFLASSVDGRGSAYRGAGFGIVIGLCALRIAVGSGRSTVAVIIAALAGVGLVLSAWVAPHDRPMVTITEAVLGAYTVLVAVSAGLRPAPERPTRITRALAHT